jgi:hypothetical protein
MKISDPLGKVYQHTMFKKKSYNMSHEVGEGSHQRDRDSEGEEEEEEEEGGSEVSDQSDDSLSTKSSHVTSRGRSSSRRRNSKAGMIKYNNGVT